MVPDVPSFSVDDGFAYRVPDGIEAPLGAVVRVPLGGRRVRGWVVAEIAGDRSSELKAVAARSGDLPVFDGRLLEVLRWAAIRYVAPLATLLAKATPPNVPKARQWRAETAADAGIGGTTGAFAGAAAAGRRPPTEVWIGHSEWASRIAEAVGPALGEGRNGLVIAPTVTEGDALAARLTEILGDRVVPVSGASGAEQTRAWLAGATRPGSMLVGTRGIALWPMRDLAAAFVIGEGRKGMKDKATPTVHAREALVKRSQMERFGLVLADLVPTAEALAIARPEPPRGRRLWGQVEIVDRRSEEGLGSLLGPTARGALRAAVAQRQRVLLFTHRRATAQRCARCRGLRRCEQCGSGTFEAGACVRCEQPSTECTDCGFARFEMMGSGARRVAAEAGRVVGREHVGGVGEDRLVVVGTERDLPGLRVDMSVVVDADGPILAPTYRAGEDALRLLSRVVAAAGAGRGRRGLIQTSDPTHPVIEALRRADPVGYVTGDSAVRSAAGFPPGGEIVVLEVDGLHDTAAEDLESAVGDRAEVLGPAIDGERARWLLQGTDLTAARIAVRSVVARWRNGGARVRVDADPVDL